VTSPAPSGGSSPLRVGGLALLGVGAAAALIGVASLMGGGGGGSPTAEGPAPTSAVAPAEPTSTEPAAAPPAPAGTTPAPAPPAGTPAPNGIAVPSFGPTPNATKVVPAPAPSARAVAKLPVRVYNNSTIQGLAARASADFRAAGWPVTEAKGYPYGVIATSTVYFRPGDGGEEASARALGAEFGLRVEPRFAGIQDASPGLIVIVTRDYQAKTK